MADIVCPVHGIPDCSPLLNGCNLVARERARRLDAMDRDSGMQNRPAQGIMQTIPATFASYEGSAVDWAVSDYLARRYGNP